MRNSLILSLIFLCFFSTQEAILPPLLQAEISLSSDKIQPGTAAHLVAVVGNRGEEPNAEGEFFIRFTFPKALATYQQTPLFQTEKVPLPSIQPGQSIEIRFKTTQPLPELTEFLRNNYPMRLYEGIAMIKDREYVLGSGTVTISAYYYTGPKKPLPTVVPANQNH